MSNMVKKTVHDINLKYDYWIQNVADGSELKKELESIRQNDSEIRERFYKDLEFGTGGLRGIIGAGTNRMNIYTVGKVTQGYADYLNQKVLSPSVAIAYDSRINSEIFARRAAEIFAANRIQVFIYKELMPTPALSFAIRYLGCSGGVVITASHNPCQYNGYKVYGEDGSQITTDTADQIFKAIDQIDFFEHVKSISFEMAVQKQLITYIGEDTITAYIQAISSQSLCPNKIDKGISIVYTPLNGAGLYCVTRALKENGFTNITVVQEQKLPDGLFPTCPYPNPEKKEALELGLAYAKHLESDLLLATDPDCDRVGVAVRGKNGYVLLSGNEVGILLFDYICKRRSALGTMPEKPILIKTIVTTDLVKKIAEEYGVEVIDVLTGFKYIGEQIGLLEANGETHRYILGFEESYGYLSGDYVRDKDGVNAALLICEMFAYYKMYGKSVLDVLNEIYEKYGYCHNCQKSYTFDGSYGFNKMQAIMSNLRQNPPHTVGRKKVKAISDYTSSLNVLATGETQVINLPKSNVLKFTLEGNCSVTIRPSGTEPKIKIYICVSADKEEEIHRLVTEIIQEIEAQWI